MRRKSSAARDEVLSLLGLARRAGAVVSGISAVRDAIRHGRVHLVFVAQDAAEGQVGKLMGIMNRRQVPHRVLSDRKELGAAIGESPRSAVAVLAQSFADQLLERVSGVPESRGGARR